MMRLVFKEQLTYWGPGSDDQFGGKSYAAPILLLGRWEAHTSNIISATGQETVSSARIHTKDAIEPNAYICLGDQTTESNPLNLIAQGALEIKNTSMIPNLSDLSKIFTGYV